MKLQKWITAPMTQRNTLLKLLNNTERWKNGPEINENESKFNIEYSNGAVKIWYEKNKCLYRINLLPTFKYGVGSVMFWRCFAAAGVENIVPKIRIMNANKHIDVLKANLNPSADKLGLVGYYLFQKDNDHKYIALNIRLSAQLSILSKNTYQSPKSPKEEP